MGRITISNLKAIKYLDFEIPGIGLHLIAGANGSGKSTLLACLRRIKERNAFPLHFPASPDAIALDDFSAASVTYEVNSKSVSYGYRTERWTPRPRKNADLLEQFGYPAVIYAGATAERITPSAHEILPANIKQVDTRIISAMNQIFNTTKFDDLKAVNTSRGGGNKAFLLRTNKKSPYTYHTERNFGLGELCVLKLLTSIIDCPNHSLVLIDELELALHPLAQIKLVSYLKDMSSNKNLTVIVSTHSASIIKFFGRDHLNFISSDGVKSSVIPKCYPAYALGQLGYGEERAPDTLIYVEDEQARIVSTILMNLVIAEKFGPRVAFYPTVHIVEVGAFFSVLNIVSKSGGLVPKKTQIYALLDKDVETEVLDQAKQKADATTLKKFADCQGKIRYLPWTPEIGIINYIYTNQQLFVQKLRTETGMHYLHVQLLAKNPVEGTDATSRKSAKIELRRICEDASGAIPNLTPGAVNELVARIFADWHFNTKKAETMALLSGLI